MVSLHYIKNNGKSATTIVGHCGGSIISSNLVITAGHCVVSQPNNDFFIEYNYKKNYYDNLIILSNSVFSKIGKSPDEKTYRIQKIIHPRKSARVLL